MKTYLDELKEMVENNPEAPRDVIVLLAAEIVFKHLAGLIVAQSELLYGCKEKSN